MAQSIDNIPMETEDGLNPNNHVVFLFRRIMLETIAKAENSDLFCPYCKTNLPYNRMTVAYVPDGVDASLSPVYTTAYFCTLCQKIFNKEQAQTS
jgi:hypothetical protein